MKKERLNVEYGYDFSLIGISSSARPHRVAWEVNKAISINLKRDPDLLVQLQNSSGYFLCFRHETTLTTIRLFKNRSTGEEGSKWLLVPEYPQFDFILLCSSKENDPAPAILEALKNIPTIELAAFLPLATLKSKENFIF